MTGSSALRAIAQENLDRVGAAVVDGDLDSFLHHVSLPFVAATARGLEYCETVDALESAFRKVNAAYRSLGVTRFDATVDTVLPDGDARLLRTHVARLWRDGRLLRPQHSGVSVLAHTDGEWRLRRAQYAVEEPSTVGMGFDDALPVSDEDFATREAFVSALNATTRALLQDDFGRMRDSVRLPLILQEPNGVRVFHDDTALRDYFVQRLTEVRTHEITDMIRVVKSVRRVCDDRIQGLYRTHVLSRQILVAPSFVSVMTVERDRDGVWRTSAIMHPLGTLRFARVEPALA